MVALIRRLDVQMAAKLAKTVALVTGASSGIGSATARALAAQGAAVAMVARREDPLNALTREIEQAGAAHLQSPVTSPIGRLRRTWCGGPSSTSGGSTSCSTMPA